MTATPDEIPTDLTLEIDANISPDRFLAAARAFFGYVQDITKSVAPEGEVRWVVRVREGSQLLGVEPEKGCHKWHLPAAGLPNAPTIPQFVVYSGACGCPLKLPGAESIFSAGCFRSPTAQ
jgi:hypothetical protein